MTTKTHIDIWEKLRSDYYNNKLPYPTRPKHKLPAQIPGAMLEFLDADKVAKAEAVFQAELKAYEAERELYQAEHRRLEGEFKLDALAEVGLTGHPKADKAYGLAWEDGHSDGYHSILCALQKYADLLLED